MLEELRGKTARAARMLLGLLAAAEAKGGREAGRKGGGADGLVTKGRRRR